MLVWLMILTVVVTLIFFGALAFYLHRIIQILEDIGGDPDSFLAKLRLGLRAIETETGFLPSQVPPLNDGLSQIAAGLQAADDHLVRTIEAVLAQEGESS